jgi:DNA-binding transcriptional LysR family regulator
MCGAMQQDDLKIFVSVVEKGSFAAAARFLGLTRSAVSRRIDSLEHRLGVRLFDRTTKHIGMTDAGEIYYARGSKVLNDLQEAELALSEYGAKPKGVLRVTSAVMIGLYKIIPCIAEFTRAHPDLRLHLDLSDMPDDPNLEIHDVAITWGQLRDSALTASKLGITRQLICATPEYIEKYGAPTCPSDLHNHNCIVISSAGDDRNKWYFEGENGLETIKVTGNISVNSGNAAYQALLAGLGIGRLTELRGGAELRSGQLQVVLEDYECKDAVPIYALFRASKITQPKIRAFIDFLRHRLSGDVK